MRWCAFGCFILSACGSTDPQTEATAPAAVVTSTITDSNAGYANAIVETVKAKPIAHIKKPSGIYRFALPYGEGKITHTIAFYPDHYRLQEEYPGTRDSTVITEGNWSPSQGYIWLYKEQLALNRYVWHEDTLEYFSPKQQKRFAMEKLTAVESSSVWQQKRNDGAVLYAIGTEPFWSIELTKDDSLVFNNPQLTSAVKAKLTSKSAEGGSTIFIADNDSIKLTSYPVFCTDGMSNFTYANKIKLTYKGKVYKGCGKLF